MYTFNRVISDNKDVTRQRRIVNVEFIDGTNLFSKEMQFRLSETQIANLQAKVKTGFKVDYLG